MTDRTPAFISGLIRAAIVGSCFLAPVAWAEEWAPLTECTASHLAAVDQAEPSVHDGARLIIDVLCLQESTGAINQMMIDPNFEAYMEEHAGDGLFEALRVILIRDVTAELFEARRARMGLQLGGDRE